MRIHSSKNPTINNISCIAQDSSDVTTSSILLHQLGLFLFNKRLLNIRFLKTFLISRLQNISCKFMLLLPIEDTQKENMA